MRIRIQEISTSIGEGKIKVYPAEELGSMLNQIRRGDFVEVGLAWADITGEHQGYALLRAR